MLSMNDKSMSWHISCNYLVIEIVKMFRSLKRLPRSKDSLVGHSKGFWTMLNVNDTCKSCPFGYKISQNT